MPLLRSFCLAGLVFFCMSNTATSQGFSWPDEPENLTVLPETTTGEELGEIMRSFTSSLGVRCSYCHVGQGPLSDYDFVSDEKSAKEKTRLMMRMTHAINSEYVAELSNLEEEPGNRINVTCITCHRNVAKPEMLESVLLTTHDTSGIEEVLAQYDELRDAYYGGFAYDFREGVLTRLAEQLSRSGNHEGGLKVLEKEIELHNDFADVYRVQGAIFAELGKKEDAIASFQKGKSLASPRASRFFQEMIDRLNEQ